MRDKNEDDYSIWSLFSPKSLRQSPGAALIGGALVLMYLFVAAKYFVPSLQKRSIDQFHLTPTTFTEWALWQPIPAMYNYANELWIGNNPVAEGESELNNHLSAYYYTWLNHYPLRIITFSWYRSKYLTDNNYSYITLRSTYRATQRNTHYYINVLDREISLERVAP